MALHGNLLSALIWIIIAAVFDFCDGFAARLLKAYSPMGKELDSLSDMVSFGFAPGMVVLWFGSYICLVGVKGPQVLERFNSLEKELIVVVEKTISNSRSEYNFPQS
jgi:hypothetical protein